MRKLMWFSVGFAAGCLTMAYLLWSYWFVLPGILSLGVGIWLLFLKKPLCRCASAVLLGLAAAVLWFGLYDGLFMEPARQLNGKTVEAEILISDYSFDSQYGIVADGEVSVSHRTLRVRVYLKPMEHLSPGDRITGSFQFSLTTGEGDEDPSFHRGRGIFLLAFADTISTVTEAKQIPLRFFPAKLRRDVLNTIHKAFPEDVRAFAGALLLGDTTGLTYEENTAFSVSGIRHVIAVSGLHMSILFGIVYTISGKHRLITPFLALPILLLFAAAAGFTPSILRACIMQSLMILAMLFKKEYDPPTALAFAALVLMIWNPFVITSVSFQLSFGCMIGIFLFCQRINSYFVELLHLSGRGFWVGICRWITGSFSVTLSTMVITAPLCAIYFGMISLIGILTNMLCLWVISFVFCGILLVCLLGTIWMPLGAATAWVVAFPMRFVLWTARLFAKIPYAAVYSCSVYVVMWIVISYLLIGLFFVLKKRNPGLLAIGITVSLVLCLSASAIEVRTDSLRVTVMDVGQGQSILIQSKGSNFLVDCGGDRSDTAADTVAQKLLSWGILSLDGVFLTHYDTDHAGGVEYLLSRVPAKMLYFPDIADDTEHKKNLSSAYADKITWLMGSQTLQGDWGSMQLFCGGDSKDENECGLCILFQAENYDILITGDRNKTGELALMKEMELPEVELLVAGHHGAVTSTSYELLRKIRPDYVAISVGEDNRFGHPSPSVLERLQMLGCMVLRTDLQGDIVFKG